MIFNLLAAAFSLCFCADRKGLRNLPGRITERKQCFFRKRLLLIQAGKRHQLAYKFCKTGGLLPDIGNPLVIPMLHSRNIRTGGNGCERRFQFMPGIRDKPLLPLNISDIRPYGPSREDDHQGKNSEETYDSYNNSSRQKRAPGLYIFKDIKKNHADSVLIRLHQISVIFMVSSLPSLRQDLLRIFSCRILINRGNMVSRDQHNLPRHVTVDRKKSDGKFGLRPPGPGHIGDRRPPALRMRSLHPLIFTDPVQHIVLSYSYLMVIGNVDPHRQNQHDRCE